MANKKHISAVISLKDNMSATMRGVRKEQKAFQREIASTRKAMESVAKKKMKIRLDSTLASKKIKEFTRSEKYLAARKKIVKAIVLKDMATAKINKVKSTLNSIGKTVAKPVISVIDKSKSVIGGLTSKFKAFAKGIAIPVAIAVTGGAALLKQGMDLETQEVSMEHFMGVGNKDKKPKEVKSMTKQYVKDLRTNANATPFETGEVISAGARALQINGGDTKKAMESVKLAEDMAAMNPGKTISDAMEALADLEMGEMARLTEFGVKASSKDDKGKVKGKLQETYGGGAEKLAETGSGKLSTITGKLKSNMADTGKAMLEPLKPVMDGIISMIDTAQPMFATLATSIGSGLGGAITTLTPLFTSIGTTISTTFSAIAPVLQSTFASLQPVIAAMIPVIQNLFTNIGTVIQAVIPVIGQAIQAIAPVVAAMLPVFSTVFNGISQAVQIAVPIISSLIQNLTPVFSLIGNTVTLVGNVFASVFPRILSVVQGVYNGLKPVIEGISKLVGGVSKAVGAVANAIGGGGKKGSKTKKNATGTKYFSGGLTTVGEHGKELVELPRGSKVHSNRSTKNIENSTSTGNTININVNVNGGDSKTIVSEIVQELEIALKNI